MAWMVKRLIPIGWSAALNLLPTFTNLVAAWLVLHFADDALWGSFVAFQLGIGLVLHVLAWGNKDYLSRIFAMRATTDPEVWKQVLISRGALLFIALPVLLLIYPSQTSALLLLWLMAGFIRQSFDAVITFTRAFAFGALTEFAGSIFLIVGIVILRKDLTLNTIVVLYALAQVIRLVPFLLRYGRTYLLGTFPSLQFRYFHVALPFFLLGFAGLLVARMELYCLLANDGPGGAVTETEVGHYQIWTNLLIYLQSVAAFIVQPVTKFLYRLPVRSVWKFTWRMVGWGTGVVILGLPVIWVLLKYWYRFDIPLVLYPLAFIYVVPVFYTAPLVLHLFKHHAQKQVMLANGAAILLNLGTSILLIPRIGVPGAMIASVLSQCITVVLMSLFVNRIHGNFKPS
jgi:hypothetical protein